MLKTPLASSLGEPTEGALQLRAKACKSTQTRRSNNISPPAQTRTERSDGRAERSGNEQSENSKQHPFSPANSACFSIQHAFVFGLVCFRDFSTGYFVQENILEMHGNCAGGSSIYPYILYTYIYYPPILYSVLSHTSLCNVRFTLRDCVHACVGLDVDVQFPTSCPSRNAFGAESTRWKSRSPCL
jgi:hypothetical protein